MLPDGFEIEGYWKNGFFKSSKGHKITISARQRPFTTKARCKFTQPFTKISHTLSADEKKVDEMITKYVKNVGTVASKDYPAFDF